MNDHAYIETRFLLRLVQEQGLVPSHLLKITHTQTGATHIIAILPDGRYLCDCCMGQNLGVVCRHYLVAWLKIPGLPFHISLIRARCAAFTARSVQVLISTNSWYQDPLFDARQSPAVTLRQQSSHSIHFSATSLPSQLIANPVSSTLINRNANSTPVPPTRTIPQRTVYTAIQADVRALMGQVQTQEQLDALRARLADVQ